MEKLSCARYFTITIYCCSYWALHTTQVESSASELSPFVTAGQRDVRIRSRDSTSVRSLTLSDGTTWRNTFGERNESRKEHVVTSPYSHSDSTVNAPTVDNGCPDGNITHCMNTSAGPDSPKEDPFVATIVYCIQLGLTGVGFVANGATYLTLTCNGEHVTPLILLLIKHQSLVDMIACGIGSLCQMLPDANWLTGNRIADFVVCYFWHSQGIFWTVVAVSIWNLVMIGTERYIMICKPFLYSSVTSKHVLYAFVALHCVCLVVLIPLFLQTHFVDGECLSEHYFRGDFSNHFYMGYSFFILIAFYVLPVVAFIFIYGYVAYFIFTLNTHNLTFFRYLINSHCPSLSLTYLTHSFAHLLTHTLTPLFTHSHTH